MNDQFSNRLASFTTTLDFADMPEHLPVWTNQIPKAFGTKLGELAAEVVTLRAWCQHQEESVLGAAQAKEIEERELETAAFEMAQALVTALMDAGNVAAAEPFRRTISWWRGLRDQELLTRSQALIEAATPLTTGAGATANADNYGISAGKVAALGTLRADYLAIVAAPAAERSERKGYTALMREKFLPVTTKFRDLDRLVAQFRSRPGGEAFVAGWFAARQVIDAGHGPGTGGGGAPTGPGTPQNVTFTQENPGNAVTANADAVSGATIYRAYQRAAGSTGDPALLASAGTLPTIFTIAPGDYEFTMTAGNDAGESAPSAPVTLTVG